nr:hypothetical protein [Tanacetum cinerariifolium]
GYSNARTLQQNRVAERKNRILIEAARTMLTYSFLSNTFWAEAVSTARYVLNRVLVTKPQNKTPYELITGKIPIISYIRPFGCHVTILNTIDHFDKFEEKYDEGFLVRYSLNSKAFKGQRQEEGIDYDEVFALVARIEAIEIFLAFASYMGFIVYQMDVKSAFLYGKIDEEVYASQPSGFIDPKFPKKVYKIIKALDPEEIDLMSMKTASTPIETQKPLVRDAEAGDVEVHLYRSMISSLMYLTASRPDIMYAVCACSRFQVTPKTSHLHVVKRIFRRLISWQCKKQIIVGTSTTEAEYFTAANCYGQVLWIQNQMLDYGFNFINTKIYIDNGSTICIVKNPVFHSKTKHIKIRRHFIRDAYEKKLIQVLKIHTNDNVADLLTKAFDVRRFNFLIVNIEMLNM